MTATTLINAQTVDPGYSEMDNTALQAGTTALSLLASVLTGSAYNEATKLRLWFALLPDIGTFNAETHINQVSSAAKFIDLTIGRDNGNIRWSKVELIAADAPNLYTWLEGSGFPDDDLTVSLFLREYP